MNTMAERVQTVGGRLEVSSSRGRTIVAAIVPAQALVQRGGRQGVFVIGPGSRAVFREVTVGIRDDAQAQLLQGLGEADLVIQEGNAFLEEGQRVSVQER